MRRGSETRTWGLKKRGIISLVIFFTQSITVNKKSISYLSSCIFPYLLAHFKAMFLWVPFAHSQQFYQHSLFPKNDFLFESNQKIFDFYKWVISEKHCGRLSQAIWGRYPHLDSEKISLVFLGSFTSKY